MVLEAPMHNFWGSFLVTRQTDTKFDIIHKADYNWWPNFGNCDILFIMEGVEIVKEMQHK